MKNNFFENLKKLMFGSILSNGILALSLPITTHFYSSSDFGEYSKLLSISLFFSMILTLRFEYVFPIINFNQIKLLYVSCLRVINIISIIFFSVMLAIVIIWDYNYYYLTIPVITYVCALYEIKQYKTISLNKYTPIVLSKTYRSLSLILFQLLFFKLNTIGLIVSELISRSCSLYPFGSTLTKTKISYKSSFNMLMKYKIYPLVVLPSALINMSVLYFVPIFISYSYGAKVLGVYFMSYKIVSIPEMVITQSINQSFILEMRSFICNKITAEYIVKSISKIVLFMLIISTVSMLFVYIISINIISYMDNDWHDIPEFILMLLPLIVSQTAMSAMYTPLTMMNQRKLQLLWDVFRTSSIAFTAFIAFSLKLNVYDFILYLGIVMALFYILLFFILIWSVKNFEQSS